jgi:hypothetical protein
MTRRIPKVDDLVAILKRHTSSETVFAMSSDEAKRFALDVAARVIGLADDRRWLTASAFAKVR